MLTGLVLTVTPGGSISGTVIQQADNSAASGVVVTADDGEGDTYTATTGSNGSYTMTGLVPGTYTVTVGGGSLATETDSVVVAGEGQVTGIDFTLPASAAVQGTVLDAATGLPLAGANVLLTDAEGDCFPAVTDASGVFSLSGLNPDTYSLIVTDAAYATANLSGIVLSAGGSTVIPPVDMQTAATLNVVLTDTSLDPLGGVTVTLSLNGQAVGMDDTDANGQAVFPNLGPGSYTVECWQQGYGTTDYTVSIAAGQTVSEAYALSPAAMVEGTVSNGSGDPIAGITVDLLGQDVAGNPVTWTATTAADGTYQLLDVPSGTYTLTVGNDGGIDPMDVTVAPGQRQQIVNVTLTASVLQGQVLASDGATPVAGASVMLTFDGDVVAEAQTDSNGDYTFRIVKPGQYLLSAGTDDGVSAVQIVNVAAGAMSPRRRWNWARWRSAAR